MTDPVISPEAEAIAGEILATIALNASGQPIGDAPEDWELADAAEPQVVSLGAVRFKIIEPDASAMAAAVGAIDPDHPDGASMLIELAPDEDADALSMGQYISIETDEGVSVVFMVACSSADLNDPAAPDLGPDAFRLPALEPLRTTPGLALLVQVFEEANHD